MNEYKIFNNDAFKVKLDNFIFDAIITDPPYNISQKNNFHTLQNPRFGLDFGKWDKGFDLFSWIDNYYINLKKGGAIIIFCSYLYISHIINYLEKIGAKVKDVLKWIKTNPMPRNINRRYVQDTEYAIWAIKPGKWTFNNNTNKYLRSNFESSVVSGKEKTIHPTQKSLTILKKIIEIHTNPDDLILDPFMGSGTTGEAALLLKRRFIGIEKDKKYFSICQNRLKKFDLSIPLSNIEFTNKKNV